MTIDFTKGIIPDRIEDVVGYLPELGYRLEEAFDKVPDLGSFLFDTNQTPGASTDDFVLTYDDATGRISLEAAGGGGGGGALPRGHISGLTVSPNGGNGIDVAPGVCRDRTNTVDMVLSSTFQGRASTTWVEGSGATTGKRSSIGPGWTANTTYHLFLIAKTDGQVDIGVDTALDASGLLTLASDYTYYRRIASARTQSGSATWVAWNQKGNRFEYTIQQQDFATATPITETLTLVTVPGDIEVFAMLNVRGNWTSTASFRVYPHFVTDLSPAINNGTLSVSSGSNISVQSLEVRTNTSRQIKIRGSSTSMTAYIINKGYIDLRDDLL